MKVYISADIEGVTGVTHWDEAELDKAESHAAREQMTAEVAAACEGALQRGATEIWVKDSHDTARNIFSGRLPQEAKLVRGWSEHPFLTLQELDDTFSAVVLIGYHSGAAAGKSPLEHTYSGNVTWIKLNGNYVSEFSMDAYTASYVGVPLVFVSGDKGLCEQVKLTNPYIGTVAVKEGVGGSTVNLHPELSVARIREGVAQALQGDMNRCRVSLPDHFSVELCYRSHARAYQYGFFPGAKQKDTFTVQFDTNDYFKVLQFLLFAV
jgi:D-amino peptidase